MGDPLSLAAGVVGLVSLTIQLLQVANKFSNDVKGVSEEVRLLIEELESLKSVLELLKKAWENRRVPTNFDLSALARIEATCEAHLKELLGQLRKDQGHLQKKPYASIHGALARIKWPFEAEKTRAITKCVHRYFCIFSWALTCSDSDVLHGVSEDVCKILKDQEQTLEQIRELFPSFQDLRQHLDTGYHITSSVLQVVKSQATTLDDFCKNMEKLNLANTQTSKAFDRISSDLRDIKEDTSTPKALHRIEKELIRSEKQDTAGAPGTGKTILTSLAIHDITASYPREEIQVAYLFCQYKHQVNETSPVLFSSILRQLLTSRRMMFPFVRNKCLELFSKPSVAKQLLKELVKLVRILADGTRKTYILVDAVDEILETDPGGKDVRNEFMRGLLELSGQCRLFVTCRSHMDLELFSGESSIFGIRAEDQDLVAYCASTISSSRVLLEFCKRQPGLRNEIISAVRTRANGVFLLACRHMRRLVSAISARDVQEILKTLSTDLDEVWGFCIERLECQSPNRRALAKRALSWVSTALRPLTDIELAHALSYRPGDDDIDSTGCIDVAMIIEVCDGMLHLEPISHTSARPMVSFTHASIAEYLKQTLETEDINLEFANTCLGYLSMEGLRAEDILVAHHTRYGFLEYAKSHWADHASSCAEKLKHGRLLAYATKSPSALVEAVRRGLPDTVHYLLDHGISPNKNDRNLSPLSVAAKYGRQMCAQYLVEAGADVDYAGDADEVLDTAVTHAARSGHSQLLLLLIDSKANLNSGLVPPIFAAVLGNRLSIVKQLLSAGCDPDVRREGQTAIMAAVHMNRMDIAESIMLGGADLNAHYMGEETLLTTALWHKRWNFAAKLLKNGAHGADQKQLTQALNSAAYEGADDLVRMMLQFVEPGPLQSILEGHEILTASSPEKSHKYKTPLHLALEGRHSDIAADLISVGLGINQLCGNPPYTPLEWAAGRNEVDLVRQLITAGADPNRGGEATPLISFATRFVQAENFSDPHSTEVLALLLEAGASPHCRGDKELSRLKTQMYANIRFSWWSEDDPNVQRLNVALHLSENWVVL
ncbi:hypothetical protein HBH45_131370 [Parastagonospora nodorum]|nr:hypothetical protein HBH45_131370 [Parastagonospora nodorum]KAH4539399.1 hypothetical protein HBH85_134540 [Parastagonospora nodorum]KAH4582565.1 hypothetical protein HBH83_163070 [Parastagonospora nodorum]KAH4703786.1 hypothetical protein HBH67_111300 [Parastagonospora nodorum]KAH5314568.1 hypothetical protein HBI50_138560 [Parastagonospora nodorum]